jgi:hypothetical protein
VEVECEAGKQAQVQAQVKAKAQTWLRGRRLGDKTRRDETRRLGRVRTRRIQIRTLE